MKAKSHDMTYRVSLRLNLKPEHAGSSTPSLPLSQANLSFRNGAPRYEGSGPSLMDLGLLMSKLNELAESAAVSEWLPESGLIDDLWLHVTPERSS